MGDLLSKCKGGGDEESFYDIKNDSKPTDDSPANPDATPSPDPSPPAPEPTPEPTPPRDPTPPPPEPTPAPRDPTPPPRDPTPPPRDPTPPPRDPTPPPRDPTPPPRDPTPPPRDHTPPPPTSDLPPSRDPTPPPTDPEPLPPDPTPPPTDVPSVTPGLHFGTEYQRTHLDTYEVHVDFRSQPTEFDVERRPVVTSGLYTDDEFPLEVALPKPDPQGRTITWKRPKEIRDKPVLFSEGTSKYDIGQRSIGTCWFLAMVTTIADKPKLLRKVIPEDAYKIESEDYDGVFYCRFWRYGVWEEVFIDDYLPIVFDTVVYGAHSATDENEMWVALLEKAFARCYGSYEEVTGGQSAASFVALTSGVPEEIDFSSMEMTRRELFDRMANAQRTGSMVACAVPGENSGKQGLIGNHEYTLTGTAEVEGVMLLRVRNPWGGGEWTGAWSDESPEWSTVPEGSVTRAQKDDGEFYISMDDFLAYYSHVTICCLTPDFDRDGDEDTLNYVTCLYGDWRGDTAAGYKEKLQNPKYLIEVPDNGADKDGNVPLVVQLIQRTERRKSDMFQIRCDVYKVFGISGDVYVVDELGKKTNAYKNSQQRAFRFPVQPGKYVVVPSSGDAGQEKEFLVRVFTSAPLLTFENLTTNSSLKYMQCDIAPVPESIGLDADKLHDQCVMGAVRGTNAGGQVAHDTVGNNPQFRITVNEKSYVRFQLLQDDKPQLVALGIRMWKDDGSAEFPLTSRWINNNYKQEGTIVLMTDNDDGKFVPGPNVKAEYVLDPGNYVLLIHLNTPSDETMFALLVESQHPVEINGYQLGN